MYVTGTATSTPLEIIIPVVVGGLAAVVLLSLFIICCVVCYHSKKSKKNEQRWTNLLSQMELMEMEMADECKRGKNERERDGWRTGRSGGRKREIQWVANIKGVMNIIGWCVCVCVCVCVHTCATSVYID